MPQGGIVRRWCNFEGSTQSCALIDLNLQCAFVCTTDRCNGLGANDITKAVPELFRATYCGIAPSMKASPTVIMLQVIAASAAFVKRSAYWERYFDCCTSRLATLYVIWIIFIDLYNVAYHTLFIRRYLLFILNLWYNSLVMFAILTRFSVTSY